MKYTFFIFFFIIIQNILLSHGIKLNSIALSYSPEDNFFKSVASDFNSYAKDHGLDIELDVTLYTFSNSSKLGEEYKSTLEHLKSKNSKKYDIYFYDITYSSTYFDNLLVLDDLIPENHFSLYSSGIASRTCKNSNGKWIGLPVDINYRVLYSNMKILNEYGKEIPKTWDEMIETGEMILKEERNKGNNDIIGYNGFIPEYEENLSSVEEFIFSFRNTVNSSYPKYDSPEALRALNKLKEIKDKLSTDEIFKSNDMYSISKLMNGEAIFLKFWTFPKVNSVYDATILLGEKEGISGSSLGGYNIGINKNILDEKRDSALEAFKYITSWDTQKRYLINDHVLSAIKDLYDDQEVCGNIDCNLIKSTQSFYNEYDEGFYKYFKRYIYDFLFENSSAEEALSKITEIKKIYYITLSPSESYEGLILFIVTLVLGIIMLLSIKLLFDPKLTEYFKFLTIDLWLLTILGDLIILSSVFMEYGERTSLKCKLKYVILPIGYNISMAPIIYKIISNSSHKSKFTTMVKDHKKIFISVIIGINIGLSVLLLLSKYDVILRNGLEDKRFQVCKMNSILGKLVLFLIFMVIGIIILIMTIYIIFEWGINSGKNDIKIYNSALCFEYFFIILFILFYTIKFNSHITNFIITTTLSNLIGLTNYILVYGSKVIWLIYKKDNVNNEINPKPTENEFESSINYNYKSNNLLDND